MASTLRILPLGGLGSIGMNCMAIDSGNDIVVVDCGIAFPQRGLGVDLMHPDFEWLRKRRDRVRAIVLTHGHEDHIGALPYLSSHLSAPIFGPAYAIELAKERFAEHDGLALPPMFVFDQEGGVNAGEIKVEAFAVSHSVPNACGLMIHTPVGMLVHSGDFKFDPQSPITHRAQSILSDAGKRGVRLLFSDSTNAEVEGSSGSESTAALELARLIGSAKQRVVVSLFASNAERLSAIFSAARQSHRRVCILGRSLSTHLKIARLLGHIEEPGELLIPSQECGQHPRERLLAIAAGSQGEVQGALARIANNQHPDLSLEQGDTVILSSRVIPGNERDVQLIMDAFERRRIHVLSPPAYSGVHVSGHACRDELKAMLERVAPRSFIPVHGTYRGLMRHEELARQTGVKDTSVIDNGTLVSIDDREMKVLEHIPLQEVFVDSEGEVPLSVLKERRTLAERGFATLILSVHSNGKLASEPRICTRGVLPESDDNRPFPGLKHYLRDEISNLKKPSDAELRERGKAALRRYFTSEHGKRPIVDSVIVRVP